jgi:hypothetical protein
MIAAGFAADPRTVRPADCGSTYATSTGLPPSNSSITADKPSQFRRQLDSSIVVATSFNSRYLHVL